MEARFTADWRPERFAQARNNFAGAGLADLRDGEPGDALSDVPGPIVFVWINGWPKLSAPSRALSVVKQITPAIGHGVLVLNDVREPNYVAWVRDPLTGSPRR